MNYMKMINDIAGQHNVLTITKPILRLVNNDHVAALLLGQIIYWTPRTKNAEGWIIKTYDDWFEELSLSRKQIKRISTNLKKCGIGFETKRAKSPFHRYAPVLHYRIDTDKLIKKFTELYSDSGQMEPAQTSTSECDQTSTSCYTEITSETIKDTAPQRGVGFSDDELREAYNPDLITEKQSIMLARCYVNEQYALVATPDRDQLIDVGLIELPYRKSKKTKLTELGEEYIDLFRDHFQHHIDEAVAYNNQRDANMAANRAAEREQKRTRRSTKSNGAKKMRENPDIQPFRDAIVQAFNWKREQVKNWNRIDKLCYSLKRGGMTPDALIEWGVWNDGLTFGKSRNPENIPNTWARFKAEQRATPTEQPYEDPVIDIDEAYFGYGEDV